MATSATYHTSPEIHLSKYATHIFSIIKFVRLTTASLWPLRWSVVSMQERSREGAMQQRGGRPKTKARKDTYTYTYPIIVSAVDVSGHAEVTNLYQQVLPHQAVPVKKQKFF